MDQLSKLMLIQCRPQQAEAAASVAEAHNSGLVLTGSDPEPVVLRLRDSGFTGPILCDADRYSGARRASASTGIRPAWCRRQAELGLVPLTDSGYLAPRNWNGLRTILRAAGSQQTPVIAMLPLAARWFATPAFCRTLVNVINEHAVPVAVAVEHGADPFGAQYVARGFLYLLRTATVPVLLLRSDVAALGALCHGAHAVAVGTVSALRHTYPLGPRRIPRIPGVSAFVVALLGYHRLGTIEDIEDRTPDLDQLWPCACPICDGRSPASLADFEHPQTAAFQHSLHAMFGLRADLMRARTPEALVSTWHEHCSHALFVHSQLAEVIPRWRLPAGLRSWLKVVEDPITERPVIPRQPRDREQTWADTTRPERASPWGHRP